MRVGICSGDPTDFVCLSSQGVTASTLASKLRRYSASLPTTIDPELLLQFAMTIQGRIFPPLLAASGAVFSLGFMSFVLLKVSIRKSQQMAGKTPDITPLRALRSTERFRKCAIISFWTATGLALASTVAVAQTATGIQFTTTQMAHFPFILPATNTPFSTSNGSLLIGSTTSPLKLILIAGRTQQILQWSTTACLLVFSVSVSAMHNQSINTPSSQPQQEAAPLFSSPPGGPPPNALGLPPPPGNHNPPLLGPMR